MSHKIVISIFIGLLISGSFSLAKENGDGASTTVPCEQILAFPVGARSSNTLRGVIYEDNIVDFRPRLEKEEAIRRIISLMHDLDNKYVLGAVSLNGQVGSSIYLAEFDNIETAASLTVRKAFDIDPAPSWEAIIAPETDPVHDKFSLREGTGWFKFRHEDLVKKEIISLELNTDMTGNKYLTAKFYRTGKEVPEMAFTIRMSSKN